VVVVVVVVAATLNYLRQASQNLVGKYMSTPPQNKVTYFAHLGTQRADTK